MRGGHIDFQEQESHNNLVGIETEDSLLGTGQEVDTRSNVLTEERQVELGQTRVELLQDRDHAHHKRREIKPGLLRSVDRLVGDR